MNYFNSLVENETSLLQPILKQNFEEFKNQVSNTTFTGDMDIDVFTYIDIYKKHSGKFENEITTTHDHSVIWGDCLIYLSSLHDQCIDHIVTSPPYYNARDYSTWTNLNAYLDDMRRIITQLYRVLKNHKVIVWNVSDIFGNDNLYKTSVWAKRRIPLSAYFITIFEECGFHFIDDIIWDKGEVQSQRQKNNSKPYPFYQYPINCYEHILIFHKHQLNKTKLPCSVCGSIKVSGNSQSSIGIQSWECKNNSCFSRSKCNRGKRFSEKTIMCQNLTKNQNNIIDETLIYKWRRDICRIHPVVKINCKKENFIGHTAPFPTDIPEMSVSFFTFKNNIVLDPFSGSFTTTRICNKLERKSIGCELRYDMFGASILKMLDNEDISYSQTFLDK